MKKTQLLILLMLSSTWGLSLHSMNFNDPYDNLLETENCYHDSESLPTSEPTFSLSDPLDVMLLHEIWYPWVRQNDNIFNQGTSQSTINLWIDSTVNTENTPELCSDGIDNDGDGLIDCEDPKCQALANNIGCLTCFNDGLSFADEVIEYVPICTNNTSSDPTAALGMPNYSGRGDQHVSLAAGFIKLGFTNNTLINSGDENPDLYVFEVGPLVEGSHIELRPANQETELLCIEAGILDSDGDGYYEFGTIQGSLASVDIDAFFDNLPPQSVYFNAIKITDAVGSCSTSTPGPDIDAVCALSSLQCAVGQACDDENDLTENDMINENCECVGTPIVFDCPDLTANFGEECDDGDDTTENDTINEDCECVGTPTVVYDCPELEADFGDACNDGDDTTENDAINEDCECVGSEIVIDSDGDGVPNNIDNCPYVYNPGQEDGDGDGIGDHCEYCRAPYSVEVQRTSPTTATVSFGNVAWLYQGSANRAGRPLRPYPMYGMFAITSPHTQSALVPAFAYDVWFRTLCHDGSFTQWVGPYLVPTFDQHTKSAVEMRISPNPTVAIVNIERIQSKSVEVFDMNGRYIKTFFTDNNQFDVTSLPTGKYNLRVLDSDGNVHYEQLIKK